MFGGCWLSPKHRRCLRPSATIGSMVWPTSYSRIYRSLLLQPPTVLVPDRRGNRRSPPLCRHLSVFGTLQNQEGPHNIGIPAASQLLHTEEPLRTSQFPPFEMLRFAPSLLPPVRDTNKKRRVFVTHHLSPPMAPGKLFISAVLHTIFVGSHAVAGTTVFQMQLKGSGGCC